jgi:hypothetical protein
VCITTSIHCVIYFNTCATLFVFITSYYPAKQIKKNNNIRTAFGMYGGEWVCFGSTSGREYLQELGVSGIMVVK